MPIKWDESVDLKLLTGIMAQTREIRFNYDELAAYIGDDCTPRAVQHRVIHYRKITKGTNAGTPANWKVAKPKLNGKRKSTATDGSDDDGGNDETLTKAKKPRASPKKKAAAKMSLSDEQDMNGVKDEDEEDVKIEDAGIVGGEAEDAGIVGDAA